MIVGNVYCYRYNISQLWLLKEWVDVPWVFERNNGTDQSQIADHLIKCKEEAEKSNRPYLGVCPSEGFYFTIVCLGKM